MKTHCKIHYNNSTYTHRWVWSCIIGTGGRGVIIGCGHEGIIGCSLFSHHYITLLTVAGTRCVTRFIAATNCCSRWRRICRLVRCSFFAFLLPTRLVVLWIISVQRPDTKKHIADVQLVSFVKNCSLNLERFFDCSTRARVPSSPSVHRRYISSTIRSLLFFAKCRMTVLCAFTYSASGGTNEVRTSGCGLVLHLLLCETSGVIVSLSHS